MKQRYIIEYIWAEAWSKIKEEDKTKKKPPPK